MKNILFFLTLLVIVSGCSSSNIAYDSHKYILIEDLKVPKSEVRAAWFEHLANQNPNLYNILMRSMIISQKTGKKIYITRRTTNNSTPYYTMDSENQGGGNIMSVNWPQRMINFDHYNRGDGKLMSDFETEWYIREKTRILNNQLRIGEIN